MFKSLTVASSRSSHSLDFQLGQIILMWNFSATVFWMRNFIFCFYSDFWYSGSVFKPRSCKPLFPFERQENQNRRWKLGQQSANCWNYLGLFRDYDFDHILFKIKTFLFYKIENWNFQHLFEKEFRETSQNFNSIRQPIEKMKITIVWISWMSWNFVRFHKIFFQTDAESFSFLSWKTKKFYS